MNIQPKWFIPVLAMLSLSLPGRFSQADDTEIYFSTGSATGNVADEADPLRPNVLFILDTSGSMKSLVPDTNYSRIDGLKSVMTQVLSEANDINVGMMRFTNDDGGAVLFPIANIDADVSQTRGEETLYSSRINSSANDAEQNMTTNAVVLTDTTLEMVDRPAIYGSGTTYDRRVSSSDGDDTDDASETSGGTVSLGGNTLAIKDNNLLGIRFRSINIPKNASISSAYLEFTISSEKMDTTNARIWGQDSGSTNTFSTSSPNKPSNRTKTGTYVDWNIPGSAKNTAVRSPDIKTIIQGLVNRSDWDSSDNSLVLLLQQTNSGADRRFYSRDDSSSKQARLIVTYGETLVSAAVNQRVALRFENINIPQGATVSNAKLSMVAKTAQTGTTNLQIRAERAVDSAALANTTNNISSRTPTTALASWNNVASVGVDDLLVSPDSINLSAVLQEVVNQADWCGGNALTLIVSGSGLREIKSADESISDAPLLNYSYQSGAETGCYRKSTSIRVASGSDDAEQSGSTVSTNDGSLGMISGNQLGLRFRGVAIPPGATIISANLTMSAKLNCGWRGCTSQTDSASVTIRGEAVDSAATFVSGSNNNISNRSTTSASVTWTHSNWTSDGAGYTSPDIKSVIQEVVSGGSWASGNNLALIITQNSGSRYAYSYEQNANRAPLLTVTYRASGGSEVKTVRQRLIEVVDSFNASDWTPIVEVMDEAARYWRGNAVKYGLTRDGVSMARISHPGSYIGGSSSYPPYGVNPPYGTNSGECPGYDSNDSNCSSTIIAGSPTYVSPFSSTLTCVSNYQVLLTDGEANSSSSTVRSDIATNYLSTASAELGRSSCLTTNGNGDNYIDDERCGVDVAEFLYKKDQNTTLANAQTVRTFTIAFNLDDAGATQFLKDMAALGNGQERVNASAPWPSGFYSATNAADLYQAFSDILLEVKKDPTSIAAPSLGANAFNRMLSRDELYFGIFTPSLDKRWDGNVKKYRICTDPDPNKDTVEVGGVIQNTSDDCVLGQIYDQNNNLAVDSVSNKFYDTARSYWSDLVDGRNTTKGGAGGELTDYTDRIIYTETKSDGSTSAPASGTSLDAPGYKLHQSGDISYQWNSTALGAVRALVCPSPDTTSGSDCENRMLFLLGKVINPNASTDINSYTRWHFNDVLHSSPTVVTYGGADSNSDGVKDVYYDKVLVGTNDGGMRMLNGYSGKEEWTFMPREVLSKQDQLFTNAEGDHIYGLDMTPAVYVQDNNGNGVIEPTNSDKVYAYIGMRRGGNLLYALDLTPTATVTSNSTRVEPKFLWRIQGGTTGFERLGQTWSQPQLATIKVNNVSTKVLIFGGGYDTALDSGFGTAATGNVDNMGNAIYIVNATTGAKILSISASTGANIQPTNMHYAIAAPLTVFDSDGDGYDDRIYAADTGGQIWRVDLGNNLNVNTPGKTAVGLLAQLSDANTASDQRRFYEAPAVVQVKDLTYSNTANYDYVFIGSGYRAHPLDLAVQDRLYALRDKQTTAMTSAGNLATNYPAANGGLTGVLTNARLLDLTTSTLSASSDAHKAADGWYINLATAEKALASPIVLAGVVYYTTYNPNVANAADVCSVNIGSGTLYAMNILDASEAYDFRNNGGAGSGDNREEAVDQRSEVDERSKQLGGGIPSGVVPIFTKEGVVTIVGTEGGAKTLDDVVALPQYRTYWYDE